MESLHIDLDEDMMLRERADAITRAIGYYPLESGRYSNGDHLALISRIYPITLRPPAVICCQHYHQQRYSTVTAMLVTVTQIPAICPPSALCRNLKASLIRNKLQHHSFLLTVSSYQTLLKLPLHMWVALYRPPNERRSDGKTDKMFREDNSEVMPFPPVEQVQNAKKECGTAVPSAANPKSNTLLHDALSPVLSPSCGHGASKEGSFVVRINRHGCARFLLGIGEASCIDRKWLLLSGALRELSLRSLLIPSPSFPIPGNKPP